MLMIEVLYRNSPIDCGQSLINISKQALQGYWHNSKMRQFIVVAFGLSKNATSIPAIRWNLSNLEID